MTEYAARYRLSRAMGVAQVGGGVTRERSPVAPFAEIKDSAPFADFDKFTPDVFNVDGVGYCTGSLATE